MPIPNGQCLEFFVYIIESPSEIDFYKGTSEGPLIAEALKLQGTPCVIRSVISRKTFEFALKDGLVEVMESLPELFPIIHISAHGDQKKGLELSNHEVVAWDNLREFLLPINKAVLGNTLMLCMSCCDGYSAVRMAMDVVTVGHPFLAMVGNCGSPTWAETSVAFSTFYHLLAKGYYPWEAVEAMKTASGNNEWGYTTAEKEQKDFIDYALKQDPSLVLDRLRSNLEDSSPSDDAKSIAQ